MGMIGVLGGEVDMLVPALPTAMAPIKARKLRALGVRTANRSQAMPELPTIAEGRPAGYEVTQWFGMLAPAGTARPIIDRLHQHIGDALRSPDTGKHLAAHGAEVVASPPEAFAEFLRSRKRTNGRGLSRRRSCSAKDHAAADGGGQIRRSPVRSNPRPCY